MKPSPLESIGRRIARLRQEKGFTQQSLADRLAISRVAVSHIEADLSIPSERTITLLAGLFKCAPHELVEETTYPLAKTERLPYAVAWYTDLEMDLALLQNDLAWIAASGLNERTASILNQWEKHLARWEGAFLDGSEQEALENAIRKLHDLRQNPRVL